MLANYHTGAWYDFNFNSVLSLFALNIDFQVCVGMCWPFKISSRKTSAPCRALTQDSELSPEQQLHRDKFVSRKSLDRWKVMLIIHSIAYAGK